MAGAKREITDPVEAAKHGIGSSRRLIAATLDDLSAHHSWLETYHRDERLRAERLRRRELRERLERSYKRITVRTKRAARLFYVEGRRVARLSKRHALVFARWASPRLHTLAQHMAETLSSAWRSARQHTPVFTHAALSAARDGFDWSVQASEEAGHIFRRRLSAGAGEASAELWRRATPVLRRAASEWVRTRLRARRARAAAERHVADAISTSQTLAQARRRLYRTTIRGLQVAAPAARRAQASALRIEDDLSARIIRIAPELRRLLQAHMPAAATPAKAVASQPGRALILRPCTALACLSPAGNRLPVRYRA